MTNRVWVVASTRRLHPWPGHVIVVADRQTSKTYVVNTVDKPWMDGPRSLVYPTDALGTVESVPGWGTGALLFVAGGQMTAGQAIEDLTHRLETGTLLTPQEAMLIEGDLIERELEGLSLYITPNRQGGGEGNADTGDPDHG